MKHLTSNTRALAMVSAALLAGSAGVAQVPVAGSATGINTAFAKLFDAFPAVMSKVEARVTDPSRQETVRMPMDWAILDGKVRLEINLEQMTSKDVPAATIAKLKQTGMARIVSVYRPDKKTTYLIYPGIQSYLNVPLMQGEVEALAKGLKLEKTPLGKETFDGHPCAKNKVIVKGPKGPVLEATTWNASDLKDFPVLIEMKEKQNTVRMHYTQVRFTKPDASQFDPPANYGLMK